MITISHDFGIPMNSHLQTQGVWEINRYDEIDFFCCSGPCSAFWGVVKLFVDHVVYLYDMIWI